jgi:hypothetical protein
MLRQADTVICWPTLSAIKPHAAVRDRARQLRCGAANHDSG